MQTRMISRAMVLALTLAPRGAGPDPDAAENSDRGTTRGEAAEFSPVTTLVRGAPTNNLFLVVSSQSADGESRARIPESRGDPRGIEVRHGRFGL
jgi:hypothetical protein